MSNVKVGDVVAWDKVPDGALVRCKEGHAVRAYETMGWWACRPTMMPGWHIRHPQHMFFWGGGMHRDTEATIIALGLTSQETTADLQRIAEAFEVWEAIDGSDETKRAIWGPRSSRVSDGTLSIVARILHAAGWRHGMTAEDAARLLAEVRDAG